MMCKAVCLSPLKRTLKKERNYNCYTSNLFSVKYKQVNGLYSFLGFPGLYLSYKCKTLAFPSIFVTFLMIICQTSKNRFFLLEFALIFACVIRLLGCSLQLASFVNVIFVLSCTYPRGLKMSSHNFQLFFFFANY